MKDITFSEKDRVIHHNIVLYKATGSIIFKNNIHEAVFPELKAIIVNKYSIYCNNMDDLYQVAGLALNKYIEKGNYNPELGVPFVKYIIPKVLADCWKAVFFDFRSVSCNEKKLISINSKIKKLRLEYPDKSTEELILILVKEKFPEKSEEYINKKYNDYLDLYMLKSASTYVKTNLEDGSTFFDNIAYEQEDESENYYKICDLLDFIYYLYTLPKKNPFHLTDTEYNVIQTFCLKVINEHRFPSEKEIAEELNILPESFSRAFGNAKKKIQKAAKDAEDL